MKLKLFYTAGAVLILSCSSFANAGLISGTHTTDAGKVVALQGLEWMSLDYTAGLSRADIENGFTDRFGASWSPNEWRYASRAETETLLGSLWDQKFNGLSASNSDGAHWFLNNFGGLAYDSGFGHSRIDNKSTNSTQINADYSHFFFGTALDCSFLSSECFYGMVFAADNLSFNVNTPNVITGSREHSYSRNSGGWGWFSESAGVAMGVDSYNEYISVNDADSVKGSLLVRNVPKASTDVPEPSTIAIFALGIMGLALRRFKKKS